MIGTRKRAVGRRPRRRPYTQGDLDGLCGVYAVVNAVRLLVPGVTEDAASRLFQRLLVGLRGHDTGPVPLAVRGLARRHLNRAILDADQFVNRRFGGRLVVGRVPAAIARNWSLEALWRLLDQRNTEGWVAILGLGGFHDHWTVAAAITPQTIWLADSDQLKALKRTHCTVSGSAGNVKRHVICSAYVTFLKWERTII